MLLIWIHRSTATHRLLSIILHRDYHGVYRRCAEWVDSGAFASFNPNKVFPIHRCARQSPQHKRTHTHIWTTWRSFFRSVPFTRTLITINEKWRTSFVGSYIFHATTAIIIIEVGMCWCCDRIRSTYLSTYNYLTEHAHIEYQLWIDYDSRSDSRSNDCHANVKRTRTCYCNLQFIIIFIESQFNKYKCNANRRDSRFPWRITIESLFEPRKNWRRGTSAQSVKWKERINLRQSSSPTFMLVAVPINRI